MRTSRRIFYYLISMMFVFAVAFTISVVANRLYVSLVKAQANDSFGYQQTTLRSHVYGHPEVSAEQVRLVSIYMYPKDRTPYASWRQIVSNYANRVTTFHNREFAGLSNMSTEVYAEAVMVDKTTAELRANNSNDAYGVFCGLAFMTVPPIPDKTTAYSVYVDWGSSDYPDCYIPACPIDPNSPPISQCNGGGGTYWGSFGQPGNFGCGLLTEDNWKISMPAQSAVMYHEGAGHALNMPHVTNPPLPGDVMYDTQCRRLEDAFIHPAILSEMTNGVLPSPSPTPRPTTVVRPRPSDYSLREGVIISSYQSNRDPDVFIINDHGFKRLFLNEIIFSFYGHLRFNQIYHISSNTRDAFETSGLFRNCETGDSKTYAVEITGEDTGTLHHLQLSGDQAVRQDPEFFSRVFCINNNEFNWYTNNGSRFGTPYTSLGQVPRYGR